MGTPYYAYRNPVFQPAMRIVQNITNAFPAVVTTTFNHLYNTGAVLRLDIPLGFGMDQPNQQTGTIVVTGPTTFSISIDTRLYQPFLPFASWPARATSYPQCVCIGEDNDFLDSAVQNVLPYQSTP